ncbi:hypothetical protein HY503_00510 [Candidatus Woesebacteria bacterium]|nr:hypothetical protein [Candidatus Woesebacteria bacterium]
MKFPTVNKVLEEVDSPINGKIRVVRALGLGTYIQVENLTQSGGLIENIWGKTLKKVRSKKGQLTSCLILGLGGGSTAMLVKKFWPNAKITGVDIDPFIVELGRKYLGLTGLQVVISDAGDFIKMGVGKYDLILVDTYIGYEFPKKFEEMGFLTTVKRSLALAGIAVFNRLYFAEKRPEAMKFGAKLESIFSKVDYVFPEANVMFVCSDTI